MIEIKSSGGKGRIVVATIDLVPGVEGIEVLAEAALAIFPPPSKYCTPALPIDFPKNVSPKLWYDYWHYKSLPEKVKAKIRDFYVELECKLANDVRAEMAPFAGTLDVEEFVLVNMVINFNAVTMNPAPAHGGCGKGINFGSGLFETACRLSHSCKPNCFWFSSEDGSKRIVRAITSIQKGEELTIHYIGDEHLVPTYLRRKALRESKYFNCECERCGKDYDDTRRFKCASRKCPGFNHSYTKMAIAKLISVQRDMRKRTVHANHQCALCGALADKKCSRCGQVILLERSPEDSLEGNP